MGKIKQTTMKKKEIENTANKGKQGKNEKRIYNNGKNGKYTIMEKKIM